MTDNNKKKNTSADAGSAQRAKKGNGGKRRVNLWQSGRQPLPAAFIALTVLAGVGLAALGLLGGPLLNADVGVDAALQISEVMSSNATTLFLQDGSVPDWIEIRNTSSRRVNLAGYGLVSENAPTDVFTFSTGTLEPGAYTLVYADGNISAGGDHAPFRLSNGGGKIALLNRNGKGMDLAELPRLESDQSYARDEAGLWEITDTPTPGAANGIARYAKNRSDESVLQLQEGALEISEFMSRNITWFPDADGHCHDYIEIHNRSNEPVNLEGWYLSDSVRELARWRFPDVTIPADGYLAVHCSGCDRIDDPAHLHAGFKLASEGDAVVLTDPRGVSVSMVDVPLLEADQAYSKTAAGWTAFMAPTPGAANTLQAASDAADAVLDASGSGVYISELMASASGSVDWVEICNAGRQPVDISGWGLSDNAARPRKWQFPAGTTIAPGQYMGVYCDGQDGMIEGMLHAPFALSADGGYSLTLSDPEGGILDRIFVPGQHSGVSYGRAAGGEGLRYFANATPGKANGGESYLGRASTPACSVQGGLYKSGDVFTVTLSAENGERIYYTLDCTDPDESSTPYTGPITISDTTVLRARAYAQDCMPSLTESCSYIYNAKNGNGSVYVVSLVSDPYNLTSREAGILVKGNNNNYWQDWEREAHVEVFNQQGEMLVSQGCAVRQQGQTSREEPQQSLKLIARSQYGSNVFKGKIFSKRDQDWCKSFIMRTSNDDAYKTRMRDSVLSTLADSTDDLLYQETEVCIAYLNGKYWGHYNLRETASTDFICQYENWVGQEDEIDYVRGNRTLQQGSDETFQKLLEWVKKNNTANDSAYDVIASVIDVQNYIEYMAIEMFVGNTDPSDIKRYRNETDDGLWRWVLFDLDWAFSTDTNSISRWLTPGGMGNGGRTDNTLFIACMKNPIFKEQFLSHFGDQMATTFSSESVIARFQERHELLSTILAEHHERWGSSQSKYESELRKVVSYAKQRPGRLLQFFKYNTTLKLSQQEFETYFGEAMAVMNTSYGAIKRP